MFQLPCAVCLAVRLGLVPKTPSLLSLSLHPRVGQVRACRSREASGFEMALLGFSTSCLQGFRKGSAGTHGFGLGV